MAELVTKAQRLEVELDKCKEQLTTRASQLEEKEKSLLAAEMEVNTLNKRVQHLEGDLETCEDKMLLATQKLDKVSTCQTGDTPVVGWLYLE